MKKIEATIKIGEDRQLVLQLPEDVVPGEHHVVVTLGVPVEPESAPQEKEDKEHRAPESAESAAANHLVWEDGILVFTGEPLEDITDAVAKDREARMRKIMFGSEE